MDIEVVSPIEAEAEVQKYTLVSDDIYVRRYDSSTIPDWYRTMIENLIAQDPTITDVHAALDYLTSVDNGYNVKFDNLDTWQSSTNALLTTLQSSDDQKTALIADLQVTKVDEASAQAIATNAIQSYIAGGSANAWFTSQVSTYASEIEANASSISTMSASIDGLSVSIDTIENVSIAKAQNIRSSTAPTIITNPLLQVGDLWTNTTNNVVKQWNGSAWVDTTNTNTQQAYTWSANASKLITNPSGQITGWSFGDGTNTKSYFDIYADNFRIVNSTYNFVPFSISGSDILFNGKVSFTNVINPPVYAQTFYQPLEPTGTIPTGSIWFDTDDNNRVYRYNGTIWEEATSITGGNTIFRQVLPPIVMTTGDLWIDSDDNNKVYWYNGTSWVATSQDVATAINTNNTTINGSKITTGTITASQIASDTITAGNIAAGAITASELAVNAVTADKIAADTITADKIASNAITASEIATGAVTATKISVTSLSAISASLGTVSAGVLSASKFQVDGLVAFNSAYPANTAPMVISQFQAWSGTTNKTLTFYGASYSAGHRADRFVASTTKFMIDLSITTPLMWASSYAYIDVTVSGNGITTQTVKVRSTNPSVTLSLAASVAQTTSISFSVAFTVSGTIETPVCTFRAFGFNTE